MILGEHITVLLNEAVDSLDIREDGVYVDCTFGRGGHSKLILSRLGQNGRLIALDRDPLAIAAAERLKDDPRFEIVRTEFSRLYDVVKERGLLGKIDGVLMDLGVSSPQLDDADRGFSFMNDGPLDMRMDPDKGMSAADFVNTASEKEIADVLWLYGEEKASRRIASAIVARRAEQPFERTSDLASLIAGKTRGDFKKHPATRSFQAIRIKVNEELAEAEAALEASKSVLKTGGNLCVITFHSLEDRLVKRFLRGDGERPEIPRGLPVTEADLGYRRAFCPGKPIKPTEQEIAANPRSRSATLRTAKRCGEELSQ